MGLLDKLKKKKKKKNNETRGKFERIEVNGKALPILNFYLFTNNEEQKRYMEITSYEEIPDLHYSEVTINVILTTKKLTATGKFADAFPKGKFKVYKFEILDLKEYYI